MGLSGDTSPASRPKTGDGKTIFLVTGAPRSGTTLMCGLINHHPASACCSERYSSCYSRGEFGGDLFSADRLRTYQDSDGAREAFDSRQTKWALRKADNVAVIGDKFPRPKVVISLARQHGIPLIFMLREPFGVAASFQARAEDQNDSWPSDRDCRAAIVEYNSAVVAARQLVNDKSRGFPLLIVPYDELVSRTYDLGNVYRFLGLNPAEAAEPDSVLTGSADPENAKRARAAFVAQHANFNAYRTLIEESTRQSEQVCA